MQKMIFFHRLATSGRHNSAMITNGRKFITKWSLYGIIVSIFTIVINSKSLSWPVQSLQKAPQILCNVDRTRNDTMLHNADSHTIK